MSFSKKSVQINGKDNVEVMLADGEGVARGHKRALRNIARGEYIIKYGEVIGRATENIARGSHVHTHNMRTQLDEAGAGYTYSPDAERAVAGSSQKTFMGYKRPCGEVGVRNEIYIIPTVGCVNGVCKRLERLSQKFVGEGLDGIIALPHQFGCSQLGEDGENIKKFLAAVALNPNAAYVLFVGLGCENNGVAGIREYLAPYGRDNIEYMICADLEDELSHGVEIIAGFAERAKACRREPAPISALCVGLKCGGSDGLSGITANPTVGRVCERLTAEGARAILTEVPEMFGAEQVLMNRCKNEEVFGSYLDMIANFKSYYEKLGFPVYENPSPGNKAGGITTLEEKSLGCIEKAGRCEITDVLAYGERVRCSGVTALDAPGNDLIAASALAAAGCQLVLFTTGRGTPFSTFVPTLKIATNEPIAKRKSNWIDFCAFDMDDEGLYNLVLATAEGKYRAKSEDIKEMAFFKTGVTL